MALTPAGQRDQRISFERGTVVRGGLGTKQPTGWNALGECWAKVLFGTGAERRQSAVESGTQAATFRTLAFELTNDVTLGDRIVHRGSRYDITGIVPIGRGPAEFEFTATATRG